MRFYDHIFKEGKNHKGMESMPIISIDNVAQYFFEDSGKWSLINPLEWKSGWEAEDFPNVAPPFNRFFVEFKRPPNTDPYVFPLLSGTAFNAIKRKAGGWDVEALAYIAFYKNEITSPLAWFRFFISEEGEVMGLCGTSKKFQGHFVINMRHEKQEFVNSVEHEELAKMLQCCVLYPCFLAISFMHCKNVTAKEQSPPQALNKKHAKKSRVPLTKYHVLNIEPMKKVLRTEGKSEQSGIRKALHICRGHFKDYRSGKGLFGKYKDIYWWESHARGEANEGVVNKDYNVLTFRECDIK